MPTDEYAYALIRDHLARIPKPFVFELGMCDGHHTRMILDWAHGTRRYYGFEPDPRNATVIRASDLPRRIHFYPDAVGHITGPATFHLSTPPASGCPAQSSLSEFCPELTAQWHWLKHWRDVEVNCWRLDDFCHQARVWQIDFLWMDVQGAERLVFDGAEEMLLKTKLIWTEYDKGTYYKHSSTVQDVLARFPGWTVLADCGCDVLLKNPAFC